MPAKQCDVVVVGAGSGGLTAAVGFAAAGKQVTLIEREHFGGECTNSGCIPSKALLHHAKAYAEAIAVAGHSTQSETYRQNAFSYVRSKIEEILADETPAHFEKKGISIVRGEAEFVDKNTVKVADTYYCFSRAIIATGSSARTLNIPGLEYTPILTNQNLFHLNTVPARILIIGGGPIGMEMGQALSLLGSKVTIIENGARFARLEDEAISSIITKRFTDTGITIHTNAQVERIENGTAVVAIKHATDMKYETVPFDTVLLAIGRTPNFPKGLDKAGIETTANGIVVNKNWQTKNRHVYALGDVASPLKFTHVADDTARQVVAHVVSRGLLSVKIKAVPKVTYTEPEIAQVGLSQKEAEERFGTDSIMRIEVSFSAVDRARTDEATSGVLVVIAKRLSGKVLGAHLIGPRAGELIALFTLAIERNISLYTLRSTIFAYPTYTLVIKRAGDFFLAQQIASIKKDLVRILKKFGPKFFAAVIWMSAAAWLYFYQKMFALSAPELAIAAFSYITETIWAPLLYILMYAIRPLTFFPATILTILSGVFFGFIPGLIYTIIGANASASVAYIVGRFFSQQEQIGTSLLARFVTTIRTRPFFASLVLHMTFLPFDLVNYGCGLARMPYGAFIAGTLLGTLLGIGTFVSIGASLNLEELIANGFTIDAIDARFILLSICIFVASLGLGQLAKWYSSRKQAQN